MVLLEFNEIFDLRNKLNDILGLCLMKRVFIEVLYFFRICGE